MIWFFLLVVFVNAGEARSVEWTQKLGKGDFRDLLKTFGKVGWSRI